MSVSNENLSQVLIPMVVEFSAGTYYSHVTSRCAAHRIETGSLRVRYASGNGV